MLQKIEIQNFKKHLGPLTVSLTPGVNVIVGKNWAGKSTLLWAIVYALFGPSYVPGGSKLVSPRSGGKPSVRLSMRLQGHDYEAYRTPDKAELRRDGKLVANGASVMTKAVEDLLGMPAATFTLLRMAQQNEASAILTLGTAKLGQIVDQITKVDLVDKIITASSGAVTRLQAALDANPPVDIESLITDAENAEQVYEETKSASQSAKAALKESEAAEKAAQAILDSLRHQRDLYAERERKVSSAKEDLARVDGYLAKLLPDAEVPEIDTAELEAEAKKWGELTSFKLTIKQYEALIKEWSEEIKRLEDQSKQNVWTDAEDAALKAAEAGLADAERALWQTSEKLGQLRKLADDAVCPTCKRPFESHDPEKIREEYEEESAKRPLLRQERDAHASEVKRLQLWKTSSESAGLEITRYYDVVTGAKLQIETAQRGIKGLGHFSHESEEASTTALSTARENNRRRLKAVIEVEKTRKTRKEWEDYLAEFGVLPEPPSTDTVDAATAERDRLRAEHESARNREQQAKEHLYEAQSSLAAAKAVLSAGEDAAERARKTELALSLNKRLVAYLRKNRDVFTSKVWEQLLKTCSDFVSAATSGQIGQVARSQEGQFQYLEEDGGSSSWMPVNAASGVQQAILGVGVRLALAEALGGVIDFILLDEVTAGAHDDLSLEIVGALSDLDQQVLVVTHRQGDAAVADNLIQL